MTGSNANSPSSDSMIFSGTNKVRQNLAMASIVAATFMAIMDAYIVNISLPSISKDFNVGTSIVSRIIIAYFLLLVSTTLLFGKMGDRFGLKKVFCAGYICFSLGSLFCGLAPTINLLIAARCLQGAGAAILFAMSSAIIARYLPPEIRGTAYGLLSAAASFGVTIGAPLGGFITAYLSWRWIFFINVPIGIIACLLAMRVLPSEHSSKEVEHKEPFDAFGSIFIFIGLLLLLYALNIGQGNGWTSATVLGSSAGAIVFLTVFIVREKKCAAPLINLGLFTNRNFLFAGLSSFLAFMFLAGSGFLLPFYLMGPQSLKSNLAGLVLTIYSLVKLAAGPVAGWTSDRISPRKIACVSIILAAAASFIFVFTLGLPGLVYVGIYLFLLGIAYGFYLAPMNNLAMSWSPEGAQGITAGTYSTMSNLGQVVGVCVFETVFSCALPDDFVIGAANINNNVPGMIAGFRYAFTAGGFICLLAFLFVFLTREKSKKDKNIVDFE